MKYILLLLISFTFYSTSHAQYTDKSSCKAHEDTGLFYYYGRNTRSLKKMIGRGYTAKIGPNDQVPDEVRELDKAAKEGASYQESMLAMIYQLPKNMSDSAVKRATYRHCLKYYQIK